MMRNRVLIHLLLCVAWVAPVATCQNVENPVIGESFESMVSLLAEETPPSLIPEASDAALEQLAQTGHGADLLEWARKAAELEDIPETTYTRYREFRRSGARRPYEGPYFEKRERLTREVIAAWLGQDHSRIDRINDLIWSICEETTWVAPAHERDSWTIDLFCAETGCELAHVLFLLGDRLPDEIRHRVRSEVKRRLLDLYLEHGRDYWWNSGRNNWTGVCAGAMGQVALMLEDDPERQAKVVSLTLEQLDRFIQIGFEDDGACLEGIGYWNYGLLHFVGFAEMLRIRTAGAIDILAHDKLEAIAQYPLAVTIGPGLYASFADSRERSSVCPFLAARLAERTHTTGLLGLVGGATSWRITTVLRNLVWWNGETKSPPELDTVAHPTSGIARLVGQLAGHPAVIAAKAGHNAEPHNNNDIGSFIVRVGSHIYLCDPGAGLYSKDYFSAKRYDNIFANSYGHSVPRIAGHLQPAGARFRGRIELAGDDGLRIVFHDAYDLAELKNAERRLAVTHDYITLEDL
ncbi:MAG TPA: hypothetical protein ENN80_03595, partial [Candidatus Hydrogenedentes bacterium]|nr:hypothetical protein [Candidatus Hydrogenedentota bacterium]